MAHPSESKYRVSISLMRNRGLELQRILAIFQFFFAGLVVTGDEDSTGPRREYPALPGAREFFRIRVKRLLHHLVSLEDALTAAVRSYRQPVASYIAPDTPLILDLTDLVRPRAKKMRCVDLVHDGSEEWGFAAGPLRGAATRGSRHCYSLRNAHDPARLRRTPVSADFFEGSSRT
jgi:hypothetical protein